MRIAHTMIRVKNLEASIEFYTQILGMHIVKKTDYPEGQFTLVFVGYGDRETTHTIELTYNWDGRNYEMGSAFGHLAIEVDDIYKTCEDIKAKGGKVVREPGPMKHGTSPIAFIEDPDGYKIELIMSKKKACS